uniref:Uncharacterized protein n=1 Tax=Cannabis sativa TaxID=3483 RepID=A0A803PEY9_CANSA
MDGCSICGVCFMREVVPPSVCFASKVIATSTMIVVASAMIVVAIVEYAAFAVSVAYNLLAAATLARTTKEMETFAEAASTATENGGRRWLDFKDLGEVVIWAEK